MVGALMDLSRQKVSNLWILVGIIVSGCFLIITKEQFVLALLWGGFSFLCTILFLFPLYSIKVLGPGDIKVLGVISFLLGMEYVIRIFFVGLLLASIRSIYLISYQRQWKERCQCLIGFVHQTITEKRVIPYETLPVKESYISFTFYLFLAYLIIIFTEVFS